MLLLLLNHKTQHTTCLPDRQAHNNGNQRALGKFHQQVFPSSIIKLKTKIFGITCVALVLPVCNRSNENENIKHTIQLSKNEHQILKAVSPRPLVHPPQVPSANKNN
jgi:hypothetical protein